MCNDRPLSEMSCSNDSFLIFSNVFFLFLVHIIIIIILLLFFIIINIVVVVVVYDAWIEHNSFVTKNPLGGAIAL